MNDGYADGLYALVGVLFVVSLDIQKLDVTDSPFVCYRLYSAGETLSFLSIFNMLVTSMTVRMSGAL